MPAYNFSCAKCETVTEISHPIAAPHPTHCAICGTPITQVYEPPTTILKGPGFYRTDSKHA